ncbi:uncharacterized protein ColSpa_03881 [Colletotrichum spaethianum]|uniref:Uncharacterized protein n=1 Tax=Colletotrichum spaethianum TaxID=700344 RepID=A0AA37NYS3_9PEZI|nr:uncharacterized protein ColSpa_03881 [Colletotrichum spaethianum]GKT43700.1 hypothetical protein ColSpa_03881 [Colletotrichum spaethianum]
MPPQSQDAAQGREVGSGTHGEEKQYAKVQQRPVRYDVRRGEEAVAQGKRRIEPGWQIVG